MALIYGTYENRHGRSTRSIASVSPSLWRALLQFRALVAIPAGIPSGPWYRVRWLGFLLGGGTAVRLLSAPFAGPLGLQVAPDGNANRSGTEGQRLSMSCNGKAGHGLSLDRNLVSNRNLATDFHYLRVGQF